MDIEFKRYSHINEINPICHDCGSQLRVNNEPFVGSDHDWVALSFHCPDCGAGYSFELMIRPKKQVMPNYKR